MEDILYLLIMGAVVIGSAISSGIKKKKEREAAANMAPQQHADGEDNPAPERRYVRKSISEILEELASQQDPIYEPEADDAREDYYMDEKASLEESARAAERLREMTYTEPPKKASKQKPVAEEAAAFAINSAQNVSLDDIIGGEFDLRRAVIESEILKPKFEQY